MRILIIEDEKLLADSLKALLEQNGFEADAACDGKTGEYYAALGIYDLLILDVMMPGRDGYEVARRLRERRMEMPILSCCTTVDFCLHAKNQFTRVHDIKKSAERALLKFQVE